MRKWLTALLAAALLLAAAPPVRAAGPDIAAPSAILMDAATGTVLYEKNASERLRPASVTKVMTLLLVMEALDTGRIGWDDTVIASEAACAKGGSQVYLEPGEEMSMDEMLKSVVVSSANDCATALAEHVAGSESAFVGMMNQRAQELGLLDTNFVNCTGLDDAPEAAEHLTTAHDIAVISRELLKHDRIRDYTTIWMDTVRGGKFGLSNTNKLVRFYQGTTGLKTGYTSAAGHCLAASAKRDGIELIAVVLHCTSSADRFSSAKALLDYGFANYALVSAEMPEPLQPVPVTLGQKAAVQPELQQAAPILIEKGLQAAVTRTVTLAERVEAPVAAGQQLGTLTISANGETLAEIPIIAPEAVARLTWWELTCRLLRRLCMTAYAQLGPGLTALAARIAGPETAEECVNDALLAAWQAIPPLAPVHLAAYLAKLTRNAALNRYRAQNAQKRGGSVVAVSLDELAECLPGGESPADRAEAEALRSALSAFLRTLPERQRQVFLARYFYALPLSAIAARFSMRENTVKTTLHRTRRRLRDYLEQEELL